MATVTIRSNLVRDDPSCRGEVDVVRPLGPDGVGGTVVGFGRGQLRRPDVPAANPAVASDRVGWRGFLSPRDGPDVLAYAVSDDGRTVCPIGR